MNLTQGQAAAEPASVGSIGFILSESMNLMLALRVPRLARDMTGGSTDRARARGGRSPRGPGRAAGVD